MLDETNSRAAAVARPDQDQCRDQDRDRDRDPNGQQQQQQQRAAVDIDIDIDIDHMRRETHAMRCKVLPILLRLGGDSNWQVRDDFCRLCVSCWGLALHYMFGVVCVSSLFCGNFTPGRSRMSRQLV